MLKSLRSCLLLTPFLLLFASGCGGKTNADIVSVDTEMDSHRMAINRVIKKDTDISKATVHAIPNNAVPSRTSASIGTYCSRAERQDCADCPADFQVAYKHHLRAWRAMQHAVAQLPDTFIEGFVMGFLNGCMGELDGGYSRLVGQVRAAYEKVESTWADVEKIAANYGVAPMS